LSSASWERRDRLNSACKQMGLTEDTKNVRLRGSHGGGGEGRSTWGSEKMRDEDSPRRKIKKWLSWVFKAGHQELKIELNGAGAVRLDEVALAMPKALGQFEGPKLRTLLESEGLLLQHFEISADGFLRKCARRKERKKPRERSRSGSSNSQDGSHWRTGRRPLSPSISSSSSAEDEACVGKAVILTSAAASSKPAPPPPPGDGWTLYKDEETLWWHYQGDVAGEWWCEDGGKTPKPYSGDA